MTEMLIGQCDEILIHQPTSEQKSSHWQAIYPAAITTWSHSRLCPFPARCIRHSNFHFLKRVGRVLCCTWLQIVIELREADKFLDFSSIRLVHSCVHSAMMAQPQHEDVPQPDAMKRSLLSLRISSNEAHGHTWVHESVWLSAGKVGKYLLNWVC